MNTKTFIHRPRLSMVISVFIVLLGGDFVVVAAGGSLSRHRAARHQRVGILPWRKCGDRTEERGDCSESIKTNRSIAGKLIPTWTATAAPPAS